MPVWLFREYFVEEKGVGGAYHTPNILNNTLPKDPLRIVALFLYPVKSCRGIKVHFLLYHTKIL
jgi:hypothetical protein